MKYNVSTGGMSLCEATGMPGCVNRDYVDSRILNTDIALPYNQNCKIINDIEYGPFIEYEQAIPDADMFSNRHNDVVRKKKMNLLKMNLLLNSLGIESLTPRQELVIDPNKERSLRKAVLKREIKVLKKANIDKELLAIKIIEYKAM